ncbi:MAG TPA: M23 family metallopeptidase [Thermomicrobiales bacterium]|nr:M23 family metallopeptidase [Thermomicrobiales bacterium]
MTHRISRRTLLAGTAATALGTIVSSTLAQPASWNWTMPIGYPGEVLGDGFFMRHGFATENTWFNPGAWHTAEDYYVLDGDAGGAGVYAVADGEAVFAGFDYPGPVIIVRHAEDLYSMYGHLDYDLAVESGPVARGQLLGTVLGRDDGRAPSHLHFEIRRFLITSEVNGPAPRYGFACGPDCAPGPGYWPIDAPEHPAAMGWLNPTHVMATRAFTNGVPEGVEVVVAQGAGERTELRSTPEGEPVGEMPLLPGTRYKLRDIMAGPMDSTETSAEGYQLWYQIAVPDQANPVWIQAAVPSTHDTGSDGRPSSVRLDLLPLVISEE